MVGSISSTSSGLSSGEHMVRLSVLPAIPMSSLRLSEFEQDMGGEPESRIRHDLGTNEAVNGYSVSRTGSMASLMAPSRPRLAHGAFFLLLHPSDFVLYASPAIIGTCTDAITSVAVSGTSELFGTKHLGVNHNILVSNIPVGSLCFGYFAAFLYQREAGARGSQTCKGASCYQETFTVWGITCVLGTLLCVVLYLRSRSSSFAGRLPVRLQCLAARLASFVRGGNNSTKAPEVSNQEA